MQYLALIHTDESQWDGLSEDERGKAMEGYMAFAQEGRQAGVITDGNELAPTATATTVRVRGDETLVTDGPFAELKEALGGYYLFECGSIDEACDWAAKIPGASYGAIEVRPVHVDPAQVDKAEGS
ncbi:MAG: YciI family protein [Actinobacteria bacterium]|nr:YciI family protein [Actinomycetota bacterium]